jgi:hypothetical protein
MEFLQKIIDLVMSEKVSFLYCSFYQEIENEFKAVEKQEIGSK